MSSTRCSSSRGAALALSALVALTALTSGCGSDGGDGPTRKKAAAEQALPLPAKPDLEGVITSPLLAPVWLIAGTGTEESETHDSFITQGAFLVGDDVAVYYARDTVFGVRLSDSKEIWRTPVDMKSGKIVAAGIRSARVTDLKEPWSYIFEDGDGHDTLVTLLPHTGKVIGTKDLDIGGVDVMSTAGHTDVFANDEAIWSIARNGEVSEVLPMSTFGGGYQKAWALATVPHSSILVADLNQGSRSTRPTVAGIDVENRRALWIKPLADYYRGRDLDNAGSEIHDGRLLTSQRFASDDERLLVTVIDPTTGAVVRNSQLKLRSYYTTDHRPQFGYNNNLDEANPHSVLSVGDDLVVADTHSVSRLTPGTGEYRWTANLRGLALRGGDASTATVGLGPTTPDGKTVLAFYSEGTTGDLLAIDVESGKVTGRWALDDQLAAGLLVHPLMAYADGHVLLARNRAEENELIEEGDLKRPAGEQKDLGWFQFPKER